jgi:hypothetical protein
MADLGASARPVIQQVRRPSVHAMRLQHHDDVDIGAACTDKFEVTSPSSHWRSRAGMDQKTKSRSRITSPTMARRSPSSALDLDDTIESCRGADRLVRINNFSRIVCGAPGINAEADIATPHCIVEGCWVVTD